MTPLVPKGDTSGSEKKGIFNRTRFKYDVNQDVYICPANQVLPYRCTSLEHGLMLKRYWAFDPTCRACQLKPQCSNSKQPRRITTIKSWMGATHFLTKRLENVNTEMSLNVLAYNLRRMISILGPNNLITAMKA